MKVKQLLEAYEVKTPWNNLNKQAKEKFSKAGFAVLPEEDAATLINLKRADKIAQERGEWGFMTLDERDMMGIINEHPDLIKSIGKIFTAKEMIGKTSKLEGFKVLSFVRRGRDSWGQSYTVYKVLTKKGTEVEQDVLRVDQTSEWFE